MQLTNAQLATKTLTKNRYQIILQMIINNLPFIRFFQIDLGTLDAVMLIECFHPSCELGWQDVAVVRANHACLLRVRLWCVNLAFPVPCYVFRFPYFYRALAVSGRLRIELFFM